MNGFSQNLISYSKACNNGFKELKHISLSRLRKVFSLMGKKEKVITAVLLLAALTSFYISVKNFYYSHTSPAATYGGVYTEGIVGQPTYINSLLAHQEPDTSISSLIFSGLYKYDSQGQLIPDLADGMPAISADQKEYTVNLKHNIKWHSGKIFTADDVVFTIQTLQDANYKSPLRAMWQATTVEKLSDYSIKFTTKDISGPFVKNLTLGILPKAIWGQVEAQNFLLSKNNLEAIGTGPYAIKEIKKLPSGKVEQITLESFPDYYGGQSKIDQVIFRFYDTEEDVLNAFHSREIMGFGYIPLGSNIFLDKDQQQANIISVPLPQYQVVFFNLNNKILNDQNVRSALQMATNRQQIIDDVFKGNAILPSSPFLTTTQQAENIKPNFDLAQAGKLLDAAGWLLDPKTNVRTNKKGSPFSITLTTNDSLVNSKAAETLAGQWRQLGITVNLSVLPAKQLSDTVIKPRSFDVLLFPQKFGADPDPFLFWHSSQVKDPGFNLTGFSSTNADKLIIDARSTTDANKRADDYKQFDSLISSAVPVIFLDQTEYIYAVDSTVQNISIKKLYSPDNRFSDIANWYIAEKRIWK